MYNYDIEGYQLKDFLKPRYLQELVQLLDSDEYDEREFLKNIIHKLYEKVVQRRKQLRKAINDTFLTLVHESHQFQGAGELLDITSSIVIGF